MAERDILAAAIKSREAYEILQLHMGESEFTPLGQFWLKEIEKYYDRDPLATSCEIGVLRKLGLQSTSQQHAETLATYIDSVSVDEASPTNILATVFNAKRNQLGVQLAQLLSDPSHDPAKAEAMVDAYRELCTAANLGTSSLDVVDYDTLGDFYSPDRVIPLFPRPLWRTRLLGGGAQPGHHILIFGRTEQGKSLFAIYQASAIASAGYRVLYVVNEEAGEIHATRAACCMTSTSIELFHDNKEQVLDGARKRGLENLTFVKMSPGSFPELEAAVREVKPDVLIVDQLAGLETGEPSAVTSIDVAARRMRSLLSRHGLVGFSVHQAGDRTERYGQEPPAWLTLSDIYSSRTGLPAQCDLIIGIGSTDDMRGLGQRAISLPKNKIGGTHDGFMLHFDEKRSRCSAL